jgi:hypothetical protein
MKRFAYWKAVVFAALLPLLLALQTAVAFAEGCGGGHPGC